MIHYICINQELSLYYLYIINKEITIAIDSYFDGGLLQLIGYKLFAFLLTVCTLGIGSPWAIWLIYNWEINHTVINGQRLYFDGTVLNLYAHWIKWLLLTIITFGIYGFWVCIAVKKRKTKHTHFI